MDKGFDPTTTRSSATYVLIADQPFTHSMEDNIGRELHVAKRVQLTETNAN